MSKYDNEDKPTKADKRHINAWKMAHMVSVAEYMRDRADDYGVDGNVAYTAGLLHDIGYLEGRLAHEETGAEILEAAGLHGEVLTAVANHGKHLRDLPETAITPMTVLMVEADLSVDIKGHKISFSERLEDLGRRYGTENNPRFDEMVSNVEFIKEYQKEHNIRSQRDFYKAPKEDYSHGSGKWTGSDTKAYALSEQKKNEQEKDKPHKSHKSSYGRD